MQRLREAVFAEQEHEEEHDERSDAHNETAASIALPEGDHAWQGISYDDCFDDHWAMETGVELEGDSEPDGDATAVGPLDTITDTATVQSAGAAISMDELGSTCRTATSAEDIGHFFAEMQARREVPIAVMNEIVDYMRENREVLAQALMDGEVKRFRAMRYLAMQHIPQTFSDVQCSAEDGTVVMFKEKAAVPKKEIADRGLRTDYVLCHVSFRDIVKLHDELHVNRGCTYGLEFDLSLDGIPESKSSGLSTDILSVKFADCRQVYTIAILQPSRKAMQLPDSIILAHFLAEYPQTSVRLRHVIADAPKRASLRGLKQHSATHGCPYCTAAKVDKKFPSYAVGIARTNQETRRLAQLVVQGETDEEVLLGVKGVSPLAQLDIDLIQDIPAEKMHLLELGIIRKIMQLSYKCAAFKATEIPFIRSSDSKLSAKLVKILGLPQFSRRTRPLDLANYKAEEFRYLALCFWPAVYETIPRNVAELWLLTVFIIRAAHLPGNWFDRFTDTYDLRNLLDRWYAMYEHVFSVRHCSYNVHVFGKHLDRVLALGPLSKTSATCYESHYNIIKKSVRPGTPSTGHQALANSLLATKYKHTCVKSRKMTAIVTTRTNDSLCLMASGQMVRAVTAAGEDGAFKAVEIPLQPAFYASGGLDFNKVLSFKLRPVEKLPDSETTYRLADVIGKAVLVGDVLSVVPWDVLYDS